MNGKHYCSNVKWIVCFVVMAVMAVTMAALSSASEVTVNAKTSIPPITILQEYAEDGTCIVGSDISLYKNKTKYYAFLPQTADRSSVLVRYTGTLQLYDETDGSLHASGEEVRLDMSGDTCSLYEYDESTGEYYSYTLLVMQSGSIGTMYITLTDGDAALIRINSSHNDTETGTVTMSDTDGTVLYSGEMTKLKGHGLTSYEGSGNKNTKNSYNLNIADKAELIYGAGESRKYTMLRIRTWGSYDYTGLSYITAFYTYDALVKDSYYNICARFVDVYIDGEYRGVYVLTERMDINGSIDVTNLENKTLYEDTKCKNVTKKNDPAIEAGIKQYSYCSSAYLDDSEGEVDITGGYVLEIMCGTYGDCGFKTNHGMYVNIKSPAYCTKEEVQYIATYVQNFENALFSETGYNDLGVHYTEYIDTKSYAAQTLIYAFYCNWEIYRTSTYMYKDADGTQYSKLTFGPVWDFESGPDVIKNDSTLLGSQYTYDVEQQYIWFEKAWEKGDYLYMLSQMAGDLQDILDQLLGTSDSADIFNFNDMAASIKDSQEMNWIRWAQGSSYDSCASAMYSAIKARYSTWFDKLWNVQNYITGFVANAVDNGDGTYTLTATGYGKVTGDVTWYKVDSTWTSGTEVGTGKTITVSEDGMYYARVKGTNNAYCSWATGKTFKSKSIMCSTNVINTSSLPVTLMDAAMEGTSVYADYLTEQTAIAAAAEAEAQAEAEAAAVTSEAEVIEAETTEAEEVITEPETAEVSETVETVQTAETKSSTPTALIIATVIVAVASAAVCVVNVTGGKKNA